jgi:hypothetical protein
MDPIKSLFFKKSLPNGFKSCRIEVYDDGSAYVIGDDIEIGFEESADAWRDAIEYVESEGYVAASDGDS